MSSLQQKAFFSIKGYNSRNKSFSFQIVLKFKNQMQHHYLLYFQNLFQFVPILQCWNIQHLLWDKPVIIDCSIPSTYSLTYVSLSGQCDTWQNFPVVGKKWALYHPIFVRKEVPCSLKTSRIWKLPGKASIMESLWLWFHNILYAAVSNITLAVIIWGSYV